MADEEIRIDYITNYITHGHGQYLKTQDTFNKQLREQGVLNKRGQASVAEYRKELERTHPRIAQLTSDLDKLQKLEARGKKLTDDQVKSRERLRRELEKERRILQQNAREQDRRDRAERKAAETRLKDIRAQERELEKAQQAEKRRLRESEQLETAAARRRAAESRARLAELRERRVALDQEAHAERERNRSQMAAIENLTTRLRNLDNSWDRNAKRQSLWSRQVENLTLRSTRRAISGVHEWTTTLATIALPAVPQFLSLLAGALGTAGTAAVGAASSLAKLGPGIGAVGGAIAGVVQVTSVWKLAMRDMDKLISSAMFDNLADFTKQLEKFTPAAQEFAVTMRQKVKPALTEWQRIAQQNIFGGINRGVNALLPRRGLITDVVRQTSSALGTGIGNFGQELASPAWAQAFKQIGSSNAANVKTLTAAAIPLARALRDIVVAGQPILDWATQATAKSARLFNQWVQGKKATGELAAGVEGARKRLEDFVDIGASWGSTALSVLKAGQATGDMITKGLRDNANAMQEWSRSFEGQRRMTEFFLNMQPAVKETGLLVQDLGKALAHTAEQSSIDLLIHQLRADLLPTLEQTMISVNQSMGPLLVETVVNLLQAFTTAMGPNGPVTMMIQGINQLAQAFQRLNELFPGLRQLVGLFALFRLARLTGAIVGVTGLVRAVRGSRAREQTRLMRGSMQESLGAELGKVYPQAMVQPRVGGAFVKGPKIFDFNRLPPEAQAAYAEHFGVQQPTLMGQLVTAGGRQALRERFAGFRAQGMGPLRAGIGTLGPGFRAPLGTAGGVALMIGSQFAGEAAGRMGASSRVQNVVGMAGMGAGIGLMAGMAGGPLAPVTAPVGAAVGAVVGGLAGLGMSFLSAKPKVDEFGNSLQKATVGLAATRDAVAQISQNQRQLQLGVRGGQLELRAAIRDRDALTRGMTDRELQKFSRTDVFKQAQLRVDTARTNLKDMQDALDKNTEQLKIANQRLKQDTQRPRQLLQSVAGEFGGRLSKVNERIAAVREGGVTGLERQTMNRLLKERADIIRDFAKQMTRAAQQAAANGQPFFARMFGNALAKAVNDGRIQAGFTRAVMNATRRGVVFNAPGSRANPASHDAPGRMGGGRITWGSPTSDSAPAMLSRGEFVVTGGGEQMLESMTFPGVLNWLEGTQPPHFMRGGRVRGAGDMIDRRRHDPARTRSTVGPWLPDSMIPEYPGVGADVTGLPFHDFVARAAMRSDKPFKVVKFPENSQLGKLQRAMGVHNFRRGGRYADGGFFRKAVLSQFAGSFSSGFSAGESKTPDAIAGLFGSTVQSGQFAAEQAAGGGGKKGKDFQTNLQKSGPKVRGLYANVKTLLSQHVPYVLGGGHAAAPGPSKPDPRSIVAQKPLISLKAAQGLAQMSPKGLDHAGFVRAALARSGFGDPGQRPQNLLGWGKQDVGKWLTVYALPPSANRAYMNVAGTEFGYYGRDPNFQLGSHSRVSRTGFASRHFGNLRRGGRVGRYATGGRVVPPNLNAARGAIAMPGLSGAGGDAANRQWAMGVSTYLQSLTTASIGNITNAINSLGSQVVNMTANADSSPAAQNLLARVSALLDAAEFALGERIGRAQAAIEDMAEETARRRTRLDRFQRQREIDPGSVRGLRQELGQLRFENFGKLGLQAQIRAQRGLVAAAAGTDEQQQLQDRLDALIDQAAENLVQRVVTRRAIARARAQKPIDRLGTVIDTRNFDLQRLTLRQQIQGISDTPAGNAQLDAFLKNRLLPAQLAREKAAHAAMVQERKRSGRDSDAFQQAQAQWQQAVLDRLGTQNELAAKGNDATEKVARVLSGQLSFDFMGQSFTDAINSGVGA